LRRRRLVVPSASLEGQQAELGGALHHYLCHVLRLKPGAELELVDGAGVSRAGRIERIDAASALIALDEPVPTAREALPRLALLYGLSRRARTELVLQKSTELGIDWILPVVCHRSVSRPGEPQRKLERWQEIVGQAARQCGRTTVPLISRPTRLSEALAAVSCVERKVLAAAGAPSLARTGSGLTGARDVVLAVGPEGGFTDEEVDLACQAGFCPVSLGPLTLRTETAAIVGLALVAFLGGRLES